MRYRTLGKTGLRVSELAMGGAFITERAAARADGIAAVRRALAVTAAARPIPRTVRVGG